MGKMNVMSAFALCVCLAVSAAAAEKQKSAKIPPISAVNIVREDVVDPAHPVGSIEFAVRTGGTVHYFKDAANCGTYAADPKKYPDSDVQPIANVALLGADIVKRFPDGVKSPQIGNLVNGDPAIETTYRGARYLFATIDDKKAFDADPKRFELPAGGYCLRAMSGGNAVPGDPRNVWFIRNVGWTVYGSPKGPEAMASMTYGEQMKVYWAAIANYNRAPLSRIGQRDPSVRAAARPSAR